MGGFRSLAYPLFRFFVSALPVLLLGASGLVTFAFLRAAPEQRRAGWYCGLASLGFILLDGLLLRALPWLGLSYGPVLFSLFFLAGVRAVIYVIWAGLQIRKRRGPAGPASPLPFLLANIVLSVLIVYSFYFEPFNLQVTRVTVQAPSAKLKAPVRIVQLSDLHVERITSRERNLVALVQSLRPDVIVLTGDYLNLSYLNDSLALEQTKSLLSQLSAPYGIYAVRGSVDDRELAKAIFSDGPVTLLKDRVAQVDLPGGKLAIIGVSNWGEPHDGDMVQVLARQAPADAYRLLLFHTPDEVRQASDGGIDLYLAGHTHGGQIRLPVYGAIVTSSVYRKMYEAGRYQVGGTTLYVSRGIGMEGGFAPRVRFLARPEVVVIDIAPDD